MRKRKTSAKKTKASSDAQSVQRRSDTFVTQESPPEQAAKTKVQHMSTTTGLFYIVMGTSKYPKLAAVDQLPEVEQDLEEIERSFRLLGYTNALPALALNPRREQLDLLEQWFCSNDRRPEDEVILYYAGHGETDDRHYLTLFDSRYPTEDLFRAAPGHKSWVTAVAVGQRQGKAVIVSGSHDKTVRVWDLESLQPVSRHLVGHKDFDFVRAAAVGQRQGKAVIVSGSKDSTVRIWDLVRLSIVLKVEVGSPVTGISTRDGMQGFVVACGAGLVTIRW
jgi:hypothetical protein